MTTPTNHEPVRRPKRSLSAGTKLAAYGGVLAVSFGAAAGIGAAVGPIDTGADEPHGAAGHGDDSHDDRAGRPHVPGVSVDADGFRLVTETTALPAGVATELAFRLVDDDGATVTEFDVTHERELHLIVVSRDFDDYLHVHPERDAEGTWTAELPALPAGSYRAFADTTPAGADGITLGTDLTVGDAVVTSADGTTAEPVIAADADTGSITSTTEVDGYTVTVTGAPAVGESTFTFAVERDGVPVVPEPYLGASGHLVALRAADLAFLHVHPLGEATADEPSIRFAAELPTPGTYRLFLDVSLDGEVRTVPFAVEVPEHVPHDEPHAPESPQPDAHETDPHETEGH